MIHLYRDSAPKFWTRELVKKWKDQWLAKNCESTKWKWPQHQQKAINEYACEALEPWHYGKCAFCEAKLLGKGEIEHFRSKTQHPLAAFVWRNLFLICRDCNQAKGTQNHEGCLKPDREDPEVYLWINPISRKVEPRPGISKEAYQRAVKTIERYKLDRPELTKLYEIYLLKSVLPGHFLPLVGLVAQMQEYNSQTSNQISLHLAGLRALAQPGHPFSLMVKSLLEYYSAG